MRLLNQCLLVATVLALTACGGGGGGDTPPAPTQASRLMYTDPSDAKAYRWMKDATLSTNTHLVLYLVAPSGVNLHGVGFHLTVDGSKATWAKVVVTDSTYLQNAAFNLGTGPQALVAKVTGSTLQGGIYQKPVGTVPVVSTGQPLIRIAVDLAPATSPGPVTFQQLPGKGMALIAGSSVSPGNITVVLGALQAQ